MSHAMSRWWPVVLVVGAVGLVAMAFTQCAVAELVVRLAARLHTKNGAQRRSTTEEWLRLVQDMRPSERPGHAGSLLWMAVGGCPSRFVGRVRTANELMKTFENRADPALRVRPSRYGRVGRCGWWLGFFLTGRAVIAVDDDPPISGPLHVRIVPSFRRSRDEKKNPCEHGH